MDSSRRAVRHLEPKDDSSGAPANDQFRASTGDSGRGSMDTTERTSVTAGITANGASSSLSRDTPLNDDDNVDEEFQDKSPSESNK